MLSKYTIALLGPATLLFLSLDVPSRAWFRRLAPYGGVLLAAGMFSPVVAWNAAHKWASFAFQSADRLQEAKHFALPSLLGSILLLLTPLGIILAGRALSVRGDISPSFPRQRLFAQVFDWTSATAQLQIISKVAKPVILSFDAAGGPLTKAVVRSARAVRNHDRIGALHAANKIVEWTTLEGAAPRAGLAPDAARLDYIAREIQIEIDDSNDSKLAARVQEARQCWDRIKSLLDRQKDPLVVHDGDEIIRQLEIGGSQQASMEAQQGLSRFVERIGNTLGSGKP